MTSYNSIGGEEDRLMDRPLFGQPTLWNKMRDYISIGVTGLLILITTLSAIIKTEHEAVHSKGINIYFAFCLILYCASHYFLMFWYRQGDLDPKFRFLIYWNTLIIILLNICAQLYIFSL